jgi:hypothetical protein
METEAMQPHHTADSAEIVRTLDALFPHHPVVELRCPDYPRRNTATAGYFNDYEALADAAVRLSGKCPGVYVTLNELPPSLLARINNRLEQSPKNTTTDADVARRRFLFVDVDPRRPSGIPADDREHSRAQQCREQIRGWLSSHGWPIPIEADSGNGAYLFYRIDLANNDGATDLIRRCLQALAWRFDTAAVSVDTSCYNAARIAKLIGTLSGKGDGADGRPHRLSRLITVPEPLCFVPVDLLEALAKQGPPQPEKSRTFRMGVPGDFDLEAWMARSGLSVAFDGPWNGKDHRWILDRCPWNDAHTNRSAYVVRFANGAIAAGCHHNGCQGHDWHSLRDLVEPGWRDRQPKDRPEQQTRKGASVGSVGRDPVKPPRSLPPYRPFPLAELPVTLRDYVEASASAIGCDAALVALPALAVAGGCIGNSRSLLVKRKWIEPPVIWAVTIAYPGDRKSPGYDAAVDPLLEIQMDLVDRHQDEMARYHDERLAWKEKPKDERGEEPERPAEPPCYVTSDATIEAVGDLLADNPRGLLLARDELDGWFQSFSRYKGKGGGTDRPHWLELHRAGTLRLHRLTRERGPLSVRRACCSVTGTIQPAILARSLDDEALAAGLGARFLLAMPPPKKRRWSEAEVSEDLCRRYARLLADLLALTLVDVKKRRPHVLALDARAKEVWVAWYNRWGESIAASEGEQAASLAKLEGYALRLALIHHVVSLAALESNGVRPVGERSLRAGIALAEWFAYEARRVYLTLRETTTERDQRRLREWIASRGGSVSVRDLQRANSRRWPTREAAEAELGALVELRLGEWLDLPAAPSGGHPQRLFRLSVSTHDTTDTRSVHENEASDTRADTCDSALNGQTSEVARSAFKLTAYGQSVPSGEEQVSVVSGANPANDTVKEREESSECRRPVSDECRTLFEDEGEIQP